MLGRIDCFGVTDVGLKRPSNQDHFLIADLNRSLCINHTSLGLQHQTRLFSGLQGKLLMVADGMGGHAAGERASMLAIDGVVSYVLESLRWLSRLDDRNRDFESELIAALDEGQKLILREAAAIPSERGMGTTLTLAFIYWPKLYLVHVGDSRCYLSHQGKLIKLTMDHTLSALAARGQPGQDEDALNPQPMSHVLYNAMGAAGDKLHPDVGRYELSIGDALLLCTDGLTNHVNDRTIREQLASDASAKSTSQYLLNSALQQGGSDNVSVIVAKFHSSTEENCEQPEVECFQDSQSKIEMPSSGLADTCDRLIPI